MNTELEYLKNNWENAKKAVPEKQQPIERIISLAEAKKKSSLYFHYGNIAVLAMVLIMICLCFYYFFPFREILSKSGVAIMISSLALRILIEIFSTIKSRKINLSDQAIKTTNATLEFYHFRKKIHGPVTYIIVGLYTLGFYMLTPEFAKHIDLVWMILIDCSYIPIALILVYQIRKGIRKEMDDLKVIIELQKEMTSEE